MSMMMAVLLIQASAPAPVPPVSPIERMSPEGQAILRHSMADEATAARGFAARSADASRLIEAAARRRPFDLAALRSAMEARDLVDADRLRARTARGINLLTRLPEADRDIVIDLIPTLTGISDADAPQPGGSPRIAVPDPG